MATEQYFTADVAQNGSNDKNGTSLEKWKSMSATVDLAENNPTGGFDCNICLDIVQDPVITLCGHLYCWPCIYKWIRYQSASSENLDQKQPQCPVCKAEISQETLVPLYGRGQTAKPSEGKVPHIGLVIPRRPPSPRCGVSPPRSPTTVTGQHTAQQLRHRNYAQSYYPHPSNYAAMPTTTNVVHPTMGMFGEMVYARIFGNSETTLYTYPNTYDLVGSSSPRMRRHVMQADKSLSRLCFFLCCCMLLCLLLF